MSAVSTFSSSFVWRRIHSLLGLLIVLFLTEHLLTNSQAAFLIGENGMGFIQMVNWIKELPYLPVIEVALIGVPIAVHGALGIKYIFSGKVNSVPSGGKAPSLYYGRNLAYTLQRISSWILLIGIIAHVGYLRFYKYPISVHAGQETYYFTRISMDEGLYTVAKRLGVSLYGAKEIASMKETVGKSTQEIVGGSPAPIPFSAIEKKERDALQQQSIRREYVEALQARPVSKTQVIAESTSFGTVTLLNVRDSFKSITVSILYTIFVLAAVFHAYNGLWTFMISWGIVLRIPSQINAVRMCIGIMAVIGALGLGAIWGTFWLNLRY